MKNYTGRGAVVFWIVCIVSSGWAMNSMSYAAETLEEAFHQGAVNGNIRAHYNERHYTAKPDATAFALGGGVRVETGSLNGFKLGAGFYTAQDLGTNDSDPIKVDGRMGSDVEVLGEAYVNYSALNSSLTVGRQKINTPFANPIDVFIIPFTFEAVNFTNSTIPNLTLEIDYIK